ncbi:MAG: response regulator [Cyanobacteria bacterium J06635_15]
MKTTFNKVKHMQQQWQETGLEQINPMLAPTAKENVEAHLLPIEHQYLRGDFTLQDIAGHLDKSLVEVTQSLRPLVEKGTLAFQTLPDLALPTVQYGAFSSSIAQQPVEVRATQPIPQGTRSTAEQPLVACIDDSPVLAYSLKKTLASAGYRVLTIQEPMRGFSQLIEHKPNLILLDLLLPNADGYSICKFLRDTPVFEKSPAWALESSTRDSQLRLKSF